jgi:hypothetical protein
MNKPLDSRPVLDPELSLYRSRTIGLLRRYFRMSIELGRLPSVVGREFFRAKISSYRITSFEDVVILVHDVDRCIAKLGDFEQDLIARVILQEYTVAEAAAVLDCTRRHATRLLPEALDQLSKIFLETGMLRPIGEVRPPGRGAKISLIRASCGAKNPAAETCQEPQNVILGVSA